MKSLSLLTLTLAFIINPAYANDACTGNIPKIVKEIENYEIIATNSTIETKDAFTGNDLTYIVKSHPHNKQNKVSINPTTGTIKIKAEARDNFDIDVTAKNKCGSASASFNVIIDEEE